MVRQVVASVVVYGSHLSQISLSRASYSELSPNRGRRGCRLPVSPPGVEAGCPSPRAQLACRARCPSRHPARADGKARLGEEAVRWRPMKLRARKDGERSEGDMKRRTPATATKSTQVSALRHLLPIFSYLRLNSGTHVSSLSSACAPRPIPHVAPMFDVNLS
jgi:hypothetical protein